MGSGRVGTCVDPGICSRQRPSSSLSSPNTLHDGALCGSQQLRPLALTTRLFRLPEFGTRQQHPRLPGEARLQSVLLGCILVSTSGTPHITEAHSFPRSPSGTLLVAGQSWPSKVTLCVFCVTSSAPLTWPPFFWEPPVTDFALHCSLHCDAGVSRVISGLPLCF